MNTRLRPKLTYSNAIATIALFIALGGAAVAAGLPKRSVGPKQLKRGAVTSAAIRKAAVTGGKLAPKSVIAGKLGPNAVLPGNIGNGAVTSAKIGAGAVIASSIKNGVVTTNKLANEAVTAAKLGKGSVTLAKLADEIAPLLGTLKSGQTLRGVFDVGSVATTAGDTTRSAVSYQFPLLNAPAVTVLLPGQTTANCAGLGGGQTPGATGGNLCVYVTQAENLEEGAAGLTAENNTRLGFGLVAKAKEGGAGKSFHALGQWAVTAP
jgi:trimeric autotransporter adhesin